MIIIAFLLLVAFVLMLWLLEVKIGFRALMGRNAGARVSGPLFSMSASGTIGKAITYGTWKGRPWCRVWFKPQNPRSDEQVNVRTCLKVLVAYWQVWAQGNKDLWDVYAVPFGMSGFNKFVSHGIKAYILDPGIAVVPVACIPEGAPPAEVWTWNPA